MKKLTLVAVFAMLVAVALPVMATDFSWSGEVTLGAVTDFTSAKQGLINYWVNLDGKVNDNLGWHVEFGFNPGASPAVASWLPVTFYYYYGNADLGGILGLTAGGIDPVLTFGYMDSATPYYSLSAYDYESVGDVDPGSRYNITLTTAIMKTVNVLISVDPALVWTNTPIIIASVNGTFGPVSAALNYFNNSSPNNVLGADVKFQQAMGDLTIGVDASAKYDASAKTSPFQYGAAVKVAYTTLINVAAGFASTATGLATSDLGNLGINANLVANPNLGVDLNLSLNLTTGATTLINGGDFSVWTKLDKSTVRLGYLYSTVGLGNVNAVAEPTDGGVYLNYDLSF